MFRVGQKVSYDAKIEISGRPHGNETWPADVRHGIVLTIREIDSRYRNYYGVDGLRFVELSYPLKKCRWGLVEPAFAADRFRPIVERKTDISIFTRILDDMKRKQRAECLYPPLNAKQG